MKYQVTRKRMVVDTIALDIPMPDYVKDKRSRELMAELYVRNSLEPGLQWDNVSEEYITVSVLPLEDNATVANGKAPATDETDLLVLDAIASPMKRTTPWKEKTRNFSADFFLAKSGWLERKILQSAD